MEIKCGEKSKIFNNVKQTHSRVVLFGSGAIGQIPVPQILKEYEVLEYVDCFLDNDESKWGKTLNIFGKEFGINSPAYLYTCPKDTIILLNISRYSEVLSQLEAMECTKNMECYIMPMMLIHNFCSDTSKGKHVLLDYQAIPKKLHYMWLGGNPIPEKLQKCLDSWKKYCPDYEIIEWNESNYDISKHPYMKQAYDSKAFGFVPDYARLEILYNEGGLYLDTDVELKRNIDDLLYQEAFCGVEKWQIINFGGLSGSVKGHPMTKKFLDARKDIMFIDSNGKQNRNTCGFYDTRVAIDDGYKINGETQNINGMNIYAYDYFHPYDYMSGIVNETENTHSIHWFNGGWLDDKMKKANEEAKRNYLELYNKAVENGLS